MEVGEGEMEAAITDQIVVRKCVRVQLEGEGGSGLGYHWNKQVVNEKERVLLLLLLHRFGFFCFFSFP